MTRVFRIHAAVELSTPALTPRTELLDMYQKPALYLDPKGNVVQLPYDQTVPFARYVARTKMTEIKRYCFDRYFVANAAGGQPVSHSAASFDAVTNRSAHAVAAAEVISVACEVFDELPAFRGVPTVLMLNHMSILDAILTYCGILHPEWTAAVDRKQGAVSPGDDDGSGVRVEDKQRHVQFVRNVCFCLGGLYKDKPHTIRQRIQVMSLTTGMRLHSQALDRLQIFMEVRGDLNSVQREVLARIGSECGMSGTAYAAKGAEYVQAVIRAFNELRYVEASVRHFGVAIPFVYAPLYNHHYAYYEGGYAFQIMTDRSPGKGRTPQVLAVGGRYDGLLKRFRHLAGNYTLEDDGSKIASDQKINTMAAAAARGKQRGATTTKFVGKPPLTKLGSDKAGGGPEKSSMAFARRTGSVHSTDVWKKMYDKAAGGSSTGSGGWDPSPGSVSIGTNLSTGSAVLGTARDVVCIGVQIQLDLVIQEMAWYQQQVLQSTEGSSMPTFGLWTRKRCDVVVASFGTRPMLRERIALARELWRHGLRTDFLFNDDPEMTMERLVEICRDQGMNWIVTLKRKPAAAGSGGGGGGASPSVGSGGSNGSGVTDARRSANERASAGHPVGKYVYKVKNILRRVECEVSRANLCEWLQTDISEQLRADLKTHESRGGAFMGSIGENSGPLMMPKDAAGAVGIGSSGMGAGGSGLGIGIGVGGGNGGSVGSSLGIGGQQQASGAGMQQQFSNINIAAINHPNPPVPSNSSGNGRLELVLVNPQQTSTKNLNRSKHKQKMALTDRAMSSVGRIMGEVKGAPVL
ncbi:eukaryotic translation initiation factor 2-alpha kinase, partial [Kickxella alabastrina]